MNRPPFITKTNFFTWALDPIALAEIYPLSFLFCVFNTPFSIAANHNHLTIIKFLPSLGGGKVPPSIPFSVQLWKLTSWELPTCHNLTFTRLAGIHLHRHSNSSSKGHLQLSLWVNFSPHFHDHSLLLKNTFFLCLLYHCLIFFLTLSHSFTCLFSFSWL